MEHYQITPKQLNNNTLVNYSYILNGKDGNRFLTTGTGFIVRYKSRYYLVSSFQILTGKDYKTNTKLFHLENANTAISILLPRVNTIHETTIVYPLYDQDNTENFEAFIFKDQLLDLAVMPIVINGMGLESFLEIENINTTGQYQNSDALMIAGFPKNRYKTLWEPSLLNALCVVNPKPDPSTNDLFIYFNKNVEKGMQGAPIYSSGSEGNIKMLAISTTMGYYSNENNYGNESHAEQGRAIKAMCAAYLIKKIHDANKLPVTGEVYSKKG